MTVEDSDATPRTTTDETTPSRGSKKGKCQCKGFSEGDTVVKAKAKKLPADMTAWFRERAIWINFIRKHRKDLRRAKPVVDDEPPMLNVPGIYDTEILMSIRRSLNDAYNMNAGMVKSLHDVNVRGGKTDTFAYRQRPQFTNYGTRKEDARAIEKQNLAMSQLIQNPKTRVKTVKEYAKEWERTEALMQSGSQFPLFWKAQEERKAAVEPALPTPRFQQYVTEKSAKYPDNRPRVFLEVAIRNVGVVGRMVVMLYSDYVPATVKNFLAFCNPKAELTYKGNGFYLIFKNYYCQTGDVVENQGYGGTSIYGPYFGNEDFAVKHSERGILTMYAKIPNRNKSQFWITFKKLESLDGKNVAFGKVVKGLHVLDAIEGAGSRKTGRPKVEMYISDCDEI